MPHRPEALGCLPCNQRTTPSLSPCGGHQDCPAQPSSTTWVSATCHCRWRRGEGWGSSVSTYKLPSLSPAALGVSKAASRPHHLEFGSRKAFLPESQGQVQMGHLSFLSCSRRCRGSQRPRTPSSVWVIRDCLRGHNLCPWTVDCVLLFVRGSAATGAWLWCPSAG